MDHAGDPEPQSHPHRIALPAGPEVGEHRSKLEGPGDKVLDCKSVLPYYFEIVGGQPGALVVRGRDCLGGRLGSPQST